VAAGTAEIITGIWRRNSPPNSSSNGTVAYPMTVAREKPLVVVVLVNWNGYLDTIECLESLLASDFANSVFLVCDNGSCDNSLGEIGSWSYSRIRRGGQRPPPIDLRRDNIGQIYCRLLGPEGLTSEAWNFPGRLFLIDAQRNLGFAGAANLGIEFALKNAAMRYVWILNNDTIQAPDCLSEMVACMSRDPAASMCGSRVLYYDRPDVVQALGGARFYPWIGESRMIGCGSNSGNTVDTAEVERKLDHLFGASMLVSRSFVEEAGLMDEGYFLYYEEIDWIMRARRYKLLYAHEAVVYHKAGASTGGSHDRAAGSPLSAYYLTASRLRFTRKFYPMAVPTTIAFCVARAGWGYAHGNRTAAKATMAALSGRKPRA
jgi:GT2 family glycosyltransferase